MTDRGNLEDIRTAREELDAVVEQIRQVPGFGHVLTAPTFDDVTRVAGGDPLVYLAAAEPGGLALVVRGKDVTFVPLDGLTAAALQDRVREHLAVYADARQDKKRWNNSLDDVTTWLWDEVMGPVLARLDGACGVVLVAGGLLGLLPLHAAWTTDASTPTGRRYVLDAVRVSYAPNARSLEGARQLAAQVPARRVLAVCEPWPVRSAPLPMARHEAALAAAGFPGSPRPLVGPEATVLSFEWQAPHADVLHLACHGFADLDNPLDSALLLAGGQVTLRRLLDMSLRVRLAVLSACETALPGTDLPDEVVALPTALLQAGVAGVVASQWAVPDLATAMLMAEFYRCWRWEQQSPAAALRSAQRWLRDTTNAEKISHFQTALDQQAQWLPSVVAKEFLDQLDLFTKDRRSHDSVNDWGAFAHVGA